MNGVKDHPVKKKSISLTVNGKLINSEIDCRLTLAEFLREELDLIGTKVGCNMGECGSCTILLDGRPVYSCSILAVEALGKEIRTIEDISVNGDLNPLQKSFVDHDALQCGYCSPGMIMSASALLEKNLNPTENDIRKAIDGNLCRCGAYLNIVEATIEASNVMNRKGGE